MNGKDLPGNDHIVRYVKPSSLEFGRVNIAEFQLRESRPEEKGVSVNWLEYYENLQKNNSWRKYVECLVLSCGKNGQFAELNVGRVREFLSEKVPGLRIIHVPLDARGNF